MKTYKKDNKIITASDKAFKLIYKNQGYKLVEEKEKPLTSLTVDELKSKAELLGIENYSDLKKAELLKIITEKLTESTDEKVSEEE